MASRTGWLLWLDRLSMTTRSPGASVGTSTSVTYARKRSPLMELSNSWVAVTPLSRSPATSVVFFRLPRGIGARRRTPLGARPYRRAMLVVAKLSSTNTSCSGSRSSWPSNQSSRSSTTRHELLAHLHHPHAVRSRLPKLQNEPADLPHRGIHALEKGFELGARFGVDRHGGPR